MTAKDLNLLTDPAELAAWARDNAVSQPVPNSAVQRRSRPRADLNAVETSPTPQMQAPPTAPVTTPTNRIGNSAVTAQTGVAASRGTGHRPWLLASAVAVMNMLFLVLAGLWLTGTQLNPLKTAPEATVTPPKIAIDPEFEAINHQLGALSEQMLEMKSELTQLRNENSKPQTPAPVTTGESAETKAADSASTAEAAAIETAKPITAPVSWRINMGDYNNRGKALETLSVLSKLGMDAQVREVSEGEATVYLVTLDNFARREDAEQVANDIMQQTQLNGLWIARSAE